MKYDLFYESRGAGRIHGCRWEPDATPKGVVQIVHGIAEHVERFTLFVQYLNACGYVVVAEDHMGHGRSIGREGIQGYFHGGWFAAVEDTYQLTRYTMKKYPDVPYILLGVSMGSFMVRTLIAKYPDSGISAAVLCGTAWQPPKLLTTARSMASMFCKASDEKQSNPMLQKLMFGSYNRRVSHPVSANDWLCRDPKVVEAYDNDPLCGFPPTAGLVRDMMEGFRYIQDPDNISRMKKDLPVFFIAGLEDPVGGYGNGVEVCVHAFRRAGMTAVACKLYPEDRHDILNELDKNVVWMDVPNWIASAVD